MLFDIIYKICLSVHHVRTFKLIRSNLVLSRLVSAYLVLAVFFVGIPISAEAGGSTADYVSISSTGVPPLGPDLCGKVSEGSTIHEHVVTVHNNPTGDVYVFDGAVFHSNQSGCATTIENPSITGGSVSGKTEYGPGENGSLNVSFDTSAFTCGRVQYDMGFKKIGTPGIADGFYDGMFYGIVVDYGIDCGSSPSTPPPAPLPPPTPISPTLDIKINGSDGPVSINNGTDWTYSWVSNNATACTITSPSGVSGVSVSGTGGPISPSHPWYPAVGGLTTLTLSCTNGGTVTNDSVTVSTVSSGSSSCPAPQITSPLSISSTINNSFNYSISASSTVATTTTYSINGSLPPGLSFNASEGKISGVPTATGTYNISISVTTDCGTDTKNLNISINNSGTSSGGGSGGGGGRSRASRSQGQVLGESTVADFCPFLTSYLRYGNSNDVMQVIKLQAFLKSYEKLDYVNINGVFDEATLRAVNEFQLKYKSEVLTPWGIDEPTGYVYKLTLSKINQIVCGNEMLTLDSGDVAKKDTENLIPELEVSVTEEIQANIEETPPDNKGQNDEKDSYFQKLASAIFTIPSTCGETLECLYIAIIIFGVLYILGSVLNNVLYTNVYSSIFTLSIGLTKWITVVIALMLSILVALIVSFTCIIMPLIVFLITSIAYIFLFFDGKIFKE